MARAWTKGEMKALKKELHKLYVIENKTIHEISLILSIAYQTVFQRMQKLGINSTPQLKTNFQNKRQDLKIPIGYSEDLAELVGILLGDGHLSHFQVVVNLGNKEEKYAVFVCDLIKKIFNVNAKISTRSAGYRDVYIGSVTLTNYFFKMGLVINKTKSQVDVPKWVMKNPNYMKACLRGFFDTDGSIYQLRHGNQISLTNMSLPLLKSLQSMLLRLEYKPSSISYNKVYLTRRTDINRFFGEIGSNNPIKYRKLKEVVFLEKCVGTQVVNEGRL